MEIDCGDTTHFVGVTSSSTEAPRYTDDWWSIPQLQGPAEDLQKQRPHDMLWLLSTLHLQAKQREQSILWGLWGSCGVGGGRPWNSCLKFCSSCCTEAIKGMVSSFQNELQTWCVYETNIGMADHHMLTVRPQVSQTTVHEGKNC